MMGVALLLAIAAVLVAARWINAKASSATNKVAVAQVDIALGSRITPETVRMVDWPANAMPPGAFTDLKQLEARVARTTIQMGEPLMETKLAPPGTQGGLSAVVAQGKRAMTVRVNDVVGVAGFAMPGNFVDILVNTQGEKGRGANADRDPSISKIVLEHILVLAIAQEASRDDTKAKVVNAVTLELSPEQTETLDLARSVGTLSLALRNQVDQTLPTTAGATKRTLLDELAQAGAAAKPAPALQKVVARVRPARTGAAPATASVPSVRRDCVSVLNGLQASQECF